MNYCKEQNALYKRLIKGAIDKVLRGKFDEAANPELSHPLRTIETYELMPLHIPFNTGNDAAPSLILKSLNQYPSIFEAVEYCSNRIPLLVNTLQEGASETFNDQIDGSIRMLLAHAFFVSPSIIANDKGEPCSTPVFFKKYDKKTLFKFGEKNRFIDGYYAFLGEKTSTFVLVGVPIKNSEQVSHIYFDFTLDEFPIKEEIGFLKQASVDGVAQVKGFSILKQYLDSNNIKKCIKGIN